MRSLLLALLIASCFGCSSEPDTERIVIEVQGTQGENAEAQKNLDIAYESMERLIKERDALEEPEYSEATEALREIQREWNSRSAAGIATLDREAFTADTKWYREQVEGKRIEDFLSDKD